LTVWLKADSSVFSDAGATLASAGADNVQEWHDVSGNAAFVDNQPTELVAGDKPSFDDSGINFNPSLVFGGANDRLRTPNNVASEDLRDVAGQAASVYVVGNVTSAPTGTYTFFDHGNSGAENFYITSARTSLGQSADLTFTTNLGQQYQIISAIRAGTGVANAFLDGVANGTLDDPDVGTINDLFRVGVNNLNQLDLEGNVSEIVIHSAGHTAAEQEMVQSYLGIKYGITLPHNYVSSTGTIVWPLGMGYDNAITGIGRDVKSGLTQKQSQSTAYDALSIGLGTVAATNAANPNNFSANNSFLLWGHNGAGLDFTNPLVDDYSYASRLWSIQETGTVGTVQVRIFRDELRGTNPELIRSTDATITTADERIPMTLQGDFLVASIDFADGDYFTFAQEPPPTPGGVGPDLTMWLKADLGITESGTVSEWQDQSGSNLNFIVSGTGPLYETTNPNFNFNPSLDYAGNNRLLVTTAANNLVGDNGEDNYSIFFVSVRTTTGQAYFGFDDLSGTPYEFFIGNGGRRAQRVDYSAATPPANLPILHGVSYDATNGTGYVNGATTANSFFGNSTGGNRPNGQITVGGSGTTFDFSGDLAEIVVYDQLKSVTEITRIQSYLAAKYGITLDPGITNYLASDGSVVWDDATYWSNVTIIGRDEDTGLNQRQSKSRTGNGMVTVGLGSIEATNGDNVNNFGANLSYLAFGDDNGTLAWTSTGAPTTPTGFEVVGRKFLVKETGSVGAVSISVSDNSSTNATKLPDEGTFAVSLLVDDDGDFSSGATVVPMTLNGTEWVTDQPVDLSDGQFFTFSRRFEINATVVANQVSCDPMTLMSNMDANISLTAADGVVTRVGFSEGTIYTGPDFNGATPVSNPSSGVTVVGSLANPDFTNYYTVRAYASPVIFEDYVVALERKACSTANLIVSVSTLDDTANEGELLTYDVV
ncbi:MAG: hypothetical protein AAGA31_17550, partial [Bacteroidota bacterium]